jgi:hypothetical protein
MVDVSKLRMDKIEHPATFYATPDDIVQDNDLSVEEKKKALNSWEQGCASATYRKQRGDGW